MKIKKILSGIVAGAIALSTLASMTLFSATAAEEVIWEGEAALPTWSTKEISWGTNIATAVEGGILAIYGDAEAGAQVQIAAKVGADWTWTTLADEEGNDAFNVSTTGKLQIVLTAEQADILVNAKELLFKGQKITVTKVTYNSGMEAGEEEVIWEGEAALPTWSTKEVSWGTNIATAAKGGILTIEGDAETGAQVQIAAKVGADWTWTTLADAEGNDAFNVGTNGKLQIVLTEDQATTLKDAKELLFKGQGITVTKVTYTAPAGDTPVVPDTSSSTPSTSSSTPTTSSSTGGSTTPSTPAEEEVIWEGEAALPTWSTKEFSFGTNVATATEGGILTIYADAEAGAQVQIAAKVGADWTWTTLADEEGNDAFNVGTNGKLQLVLTAEQAETLVNAKELLFKGQNITVTKVTYKGQGNGGTEEIWAGEAALPTWSTKEFSWGTNIPTAAKGGILTIEGDAETGAQVQIAAKVGADWTWTTLADADGNDAFNVGTNGKLQIVLTEEQAEILRTAKELLFKGQNITVTKVSYTAPAGDTPVVPDSSSVADESSVVVPESSVVVPESSVVVPESSVVVPESSVVVPESSSVADESSEIELPGVELDDPTNVKYQLADNGSKVRFIWFVNEADVVAATEGSIKLSVSPDFDSDPIITTTPITTAYRSVYAAGKVVTAPAGKVIIISPITHGLTETSGVRCVFSLDSLSSKYARTYEAM